MLLARRFPVSEPILLGGCARFIEAWVATGASCLPDVAGEVI
jgi:hypothetical protein